ncbi:rod shape-determining protein MreC [bacterium]
MIPSRKKAYTYEQKKSIIVLTSLIFLSLIFISIDITYHVESVKNFIGYVLLPANKTFKEFFEYNEKVSRRVKNLFQVYLENENLEYRLLLSENIRLKNILKFKEKQKEKVVAAQIIGRGLSEWFKTILIDKGSDAGINEKDIVIVDSEGLSELVGRVIETQKDFSKVLLLTDSISSIAGYLNESRINGIVEGQDNEYFIMKNIDTESDVKIDDIVISSGLGGVFPFGLYIGDVHSIVFHNRGKYKDIIIKPVIELNKLRDIFVIVGEKNV